MEDCLDASISLDELLDIVEALYFLDFWNTRKIVSERMSNSIVSCLRYIFQGKISGDAVTNSWIFNHKQNIGWVVKAMESIGKELGGRV